MLLRKFFEILTLIGLSSAVTSKNGTVTANIPSLGPVNGNIEITGNGAIFMSFMGIPFAEPPVGDLRFQPPVVKRPWSGTWNATYERGCCYQMTSDRPEETEDCLYINVYTPTRTFKEGLPVMFYIYGGGFIEGYSERVNYGPEHLMEHEVILVTFNYRVGPFGFLSTGDTVIPGNLGLKDQLLALKWVNEHIQSFGGDPKKITLIGQSAGSASVMYHLLSPKSKGLFRAAIGESASALSAWAYQNNLPQLTHYLGTLINSEFKTKKPTSAELLKYLKSIPAKTIDAASLQLSNMNTPGYIQIEQGFYFTPTLEPEHEGAFLTGSMYHLFRSGNFTHVPTLMGVNTEECLFFADDPNQVAAFVRTFDETNNFLVPLGLRLSKKEDFDKVAKLIKDFYSPNAAFAANSRQLIKYFSDQGFARSIIKQALLQSKFSPVYFYQFAYHGVLGGHVSQSVAGFSEDVRHGEEMSFVITRSYGGYNTTDLTKYPLVDQLVQKRMINFFTNFVKYLNPTPNQETLFGNLKWPTVDPENFLYMNIGSELEIRRDPKNEMYQFWETIFNDFGQHLISY